MGEPTEYETITVGSTPIGFDDTKRNRATYAKITVERAPVNIRIDSLMPSSDDGHLINANGQVIIRGKVALGNFRAIAENGATALLKVTYFAGETCGESLEIRNDGTNRMATTQHYINAIHEDGYQGSGIAKVANLQGLTMLGLSISGTAQGLNLAFLGSVDGTIFNPIVGVKISDPTMPIANNTDGGGVAPKTVTVDPGTQIWTCNNHGFTTYQEIHISSTGNLPSGLAVGAKYYAAPIDADTFYVYSYLPAPGGVYAQVFPPVFVATVMDSGTGTLSIGALAEQWQFDIKGLQFFKPRIDAITSGYVTVTSYGEG